MKSTGVVRKLDNLGRIVIPIELRKNLGIELQDPLEIYMDGDSIILRKYYAGCVFCGESDDTVLFKGKRVCPKCIEQLKK